MMTITQLVLGFATILMSGVVSTIVTYKLNARRDRRDVQRKKLEELFRAVARYCNGLTVEFLGYSNVMLGKITYDQALDMTIARPADPDRPYETAQMLIGIYFPDMDRHFSEIARARSEGNAIVNQFKTQYKAGVTSDRSAYDRLWEVCRDLEKSEQTFRQAIRKSAKSL